MLKNLNIQNFRNLQNIQINNLKRVNLITGKNNTGKSSVLEAISIFASKGDISWINKLLEDRDEITRPNIELENIEDEMLKSLSSIFFNREIDFQGHNSILIGEINNNELSISFVRYIMENVYGIDEETKETVSVGSKRRIITDSQIDYNPDYRLGVEIKYNGVSSVTRINDRLLRNRSKYIESYKNFQFIRTANIDREINSTLWDSIALSEKENLVIDAMKIIEADLERITFINENKLPRKRVPVAKVYNNSDVFPLKSMGDGVNRLLTISLGLVNSDKGYLLIDEFENGLHYSVQEKLWEMIFLLAIKLDVQVFVTTHSSDCIQAFGEVILKKYKGEGELVRLVRDESGVSVKNFSENEIDIATEQDIDLR